MNFLSEVNETSRFLSQTRNINWNNFAMRILDDDLFGEIALLTSHFGHIQMTVKQLRDHFSKVSFET